MKEVAQKGIVNANIVLPETRFTPVSRETFVELRVANGFGHMMRPMCKKTIAKSRRLSAIYNANGRFPIYP